MKYPIHIAGVELRADANSRLEFTYRYLNPGLRSFGIKVSKYSYKEDIPQISLSSNLIGNGISHEYMIDGVCVKMGWIMGNSITKYTISGASLYLVASRNLHQYSRTFVDANGSQTDYYPRVNYAWGGEFEFYSGLRLGNKLVLCLIGQMGVKPMKTYLYNNQVQDLPSYLHYAPSQGYGTLRVYVNGSLGLNYMF